jgi:hypothetical protein
MRGRSLSSSPTCRSRRPAVDSLLALFDAQRDPLAGRSVDEKVKLLKHTSYRDYLIRVCGCSEEVANCFQGRTHGLFRPWL